MAPRVVITGMGLLTSLGNDVTTTWQNLCQGKSGVAPITAYDSSAFRVHFGAALKDFDPALYMERKEMRRADPHQQFALAAARQALTQAGLVITPEYADEVGVCVSSCLGGLSVFADTHTVITEKGPERVSVHCINMMTPNIASSLISIMSGAKGPNWSLVSAHATSSNAIGESWEMIRRGDVKAMIAGGADKSIVPIAMASFDNMRALSRNNADPQGACRPFDRLRDGFVMGEGAGVVILEELEFARARGATILAELVGYGSAADAYHITEPAPDGRGLIQAMRRALAKAALQPAQIEYINAHGTATPYNDRIETLAIKSFFAAHARHLPISATKSMIGHTLGASGAIEAIFTIQTLRTDIIPPTINLRQPDPDCDLDYVANQARSAHITVAMSNSIGFGGHNASLVFRRYEE